METKPRGVADTQTLGIIALVALLLGVFALLPRLFSHSGSSLQDKDAPDFTLPVILNGAELGDPHPAGDAERARGRPVILDFWASWCRPCRMETPIVDRAARKFREQGLVVVGVDADDDADDGRQWAARAGVMFPIAHDDRRAAQRGYGVNSLPTLVVISKTGKVVAIRSGVADDAELDRLIAQVL